MLEKMSVEEKEHISELKTNIDRRKLKIEIEEWKTAFERLAFWIRNHYSECSLFDVTEKIKELRPK